MTVFHNATRSLWNGVRNITDSQQWDKKLNELCKARRAYLFSTSNYILFSHRNKLFTAGNEKNLNYYLEVGGRWECKRSRKGFKLLLRRRPCLLKTISLQSTEGLQQALKTLSFLKGSHLQFTGNRNLSDEEGDTRLRFCHWILPFFVCVFGWPCCYHIMDANKPLANMTALVRLQV